MKFAEQQNSVRFQEYPRKNKCYNYIKFSKMYVFRAFFVEKSLDISYNKKRIKKESEG